MALDIVIAADATHAEVAADLCAAIPLGWPDQGEEPRLHRRDLSQVADPGAPAAGAMVYVLLPAAHTPSAVLRGLVDALTEQGRPVVLLSADAAGDRARLCAPGLCVLEIQTPGSALAATLFGIASQQRALEGLRSELRIARTSTGGITGEMNRIHEELHLASTVQRELLPKRLPRDAHGLQFASLYRPATYVSGDMYDISWIDDRHVGFMLADAVGHGVPAALLTMIIARALVRTGEGGSLIEPAEAMSQLNREMVRFSRGGQRFATAVYGVIDVHTHEVRLAGAGHPPPLCLRGEDAARIETGGPLLGVFEDAPYDQVSFRLEPGQTLLVYSDGFEMAFPGEGADPHARRTPTTEYVREFARFGRAAGEEGEGVAAAMERLGAALDDQPGSLHQIDDLTAIAIGAGAPSAARIEPRVAAA